PEAAMFDVKSILTQILGAGGQQAGAGAPRPHGQSGAQTGSGDLMTQVQDFAKGNLGGLAGGAIAGSLATVLLGGKGGKGPQISPSAMKLGGLAILGGLAYKAWQNHQAMQQEKAGGHPAPPPPPPQAPVQIAPPPPQTPFAPGGQDEQKLGELLIRAMIAAARADGRIDGEEIGRIREGLKASGAGDDQTFLIEQLGKPDDLDEIAREAQGPEVASEVWLAARLAIEPDAPAEQAFLRNFAQKLGLDAQLVTQLEATAAQAKQSGVATH
ncbi:MAG: DUF533 domain-containing protein, partial [Hansschlegelia sp.]